MKLLVLGGPKFLGRAVADAALARGHEVTFFNRGRTNSELYPEVEKLRGDRGGDLAPLRGRSWDAVVDTSGYLPGHVEASAKALAGTGRYCFVSSISVYADFSGPIDEDSETLPLGGAPIDRLTSDYSNYGALKALCERAVEDEFGDRAVVIRPGLIVGAHDPSGRFTYWPHRVARGGEMLAPAPPHRTVQFLDVRDLAEWMLELCQGDTTGRFNATSPGVSWGELLATCRRMAASKASITWVPDGFLVQQGVGEWMELPMWIADSGRTGANAAVVSRALSAGLSFRPLVDTIRATLELAETTVDAGLTPDREVAIIAAWHAR